MDIFAVIFTILSVGTIVFSLFKPKYGALCYLIYMYLAPYLYINGYVIYARSSAFMFLFFFLFKFSKTMKKENFKPLIPYIVFLLWNLLFVVTSEHVDYSFSMWLTEVSSIFFIIFLYANICADLGTVNVFKWTLFGISLAFTLYGLFLTTMPGINPYRIITAPMFGQEFNEAYAAGNSALSSSTIIVEERLFGRISSVFAHPMTYGLNLGFFFIYSIYILKDKPFILFPVLGIITYAIFTSGVRTPIGALAITVLAIMIYMKNIKIFIWGILAFLFVIYILPLLSPNVSDYVMSITNSDESAVRGSSLNMRIEQMKGCFEIAEDHLLLGRGYDWTHWYNDNFGGHPKALWFESIVYSILVNSGLLGFLLWGWFSIRYYRFARLNIEDVTLRMVILALFLYFIVYSLITGDFHIKNMFVFYVILMGINMENKQSVLKVS